jgi:hypothetical protein
MKMTLPPTAILGGRKSFVHELESFFEKTKDYKAAVGGKVIFMLPCILQ